MTAQENSARKTLVDEVVPAGKPWSGIVKQGQLLRIVDLEGRQAVDFLCYNAHDAEERYHAPNTIKASGTIFLTKGHVLYSDVARPIFTIVEDSFGGHDTIGGCCSAPSNEMLYGVKNCPGCRENFLAALARHGMGRRDIVPNINFFMRVPVAKTGEAAIALGVSKPGAFVELRAEMDALAVISNCPQINNPCNDFNPTPIRVIVTIPR
ncbi:MAG TPA: DUF1989 domain-containing protein [Alphaproteobacteria bacterium]|nr:DUF1989 domain-containing protein [Alphaproteobacteria bacterium]